jgi:hypothetical protein
VHVPNDEAVLGHGRPLTLKPKVVIGFLGLLPRPCNQGMVQGVSAPETRMAVHKLAPRFRGVEAAWGRPLLNSL